MTIKISKAKKFAVMLKKNLKYLKQYNRYAKDLTIHSENHHP